MPTEAPMTQGALAILRARAQQGMRGLGNYARNFAGRQVTGIRNAIPGTQNWQWQQTLDALTNTVLPGNWYNSETGQWQNPLTGRPFSWSQPNARPLQPGQVPGLSAGAMPGPAFGDQTGAGAIPAVPNYTDPNAWGPPEYLAGAAPNVRRPPPTAVRGGRLRGSTIAEGRGAQDFVEGLRGTSTYSRFVNPDPSPNNPTFREK